MTASLSARWLTFWFVPTPPGNLGLCRLLFFSGLLWLYHAHDFTGWARVDDAFWMPITLFKRLHLPVLPADALQILQGLWKTSLVFGALGLLTRSSTVVAFLLGTYLLGLPHNFGKVHHSDAIIVLTLGILALARCDKAWSVDRLRRIARRGEISPHPPRPSGEFTWPVRLVQVLITLVFFGAGVSKLRHSGLEWIFSHNLSTLFVKHGAPLGLAVAKYEGLCRLLAAATIAGETLAPLALVNRIARLVLIPGLFLMQVGILFLMDVSFKQFLVCYLFWVPWDRLLHRGLLRLRPQRSHALLFDGACGLCQRTVALIQTLDLTQRITYYDVARDWPSVQRRFPRLSQEACLADMHLITARGRTVRGFDAYRGLAWRLPLGWFLLPLLYLPGARFIGRRIYAAIAARRRRLGCPLPAHSFPPSTDREKAA